MVISVFLFAIGLVLLIKGGDWFVDGATGIAHKFHIPEMLIGATVVSIGTTLPEVMVSATSAIQGNGAMAYGNAIGSVICNTSLIAALTIAIRPSIADKKSLKFPVIFFFCVAAFYAFVAYFFGEFSLWVGIVLLAAFVAYMTVLIIQAKNSMDVCKINASDASDTRAVSVASNDSEGNSNDGFVGFLIVGIGLITVQTVSVLVSCFADEPLNFFTGVSGFVSTVSAVVDFVGYYISGIIGLILLVIGVVKAMARGKLKALSSNIVLLILGAAVIAIGADLLVDNGTKIAEELGVPSTVIALTFVALGTSLPELVTAITALIKGHSALSLGNIIGANIFNLVLVSGAAITISPFGVPAEKYILGINSSLLIDIPVMLAVMALLTLPTVFKGKLSRWQGIFLLCIYAAFCVIQFVF